ncbi:MAG: tRNA glutamyl-Q(34) synthetase GluQRS [Muribaculaceae bacterium]|nr:tRNA glutamyl-Q(34) synthetase GluQRS [Muribaculaceae bacterium]
MTVGRFAPSPTGRMHLGNVFTALISWLSAKKNGGKWILRVEDLDPQRSRLEYARMIEDDLDWLGLEWDGGGIDGAGASVSYIQSQRGEIYEDMLQRLDKTGLTYPCRCTRADLMATQAPHESDGRIVYAGTCRPERLGGRVEVDENRPERATRLWVPDEVISFTDRLYGEQRVNLAEHCGDFVVRRADGAWAYQLAVVADDALMGVTEVVRGSDLLLSSAQQIYLYRLLGFDIPEFAHVPLLCNEKGERLSKRDTSLTMEELRKDYTPSHLIGLLAWYAGIMPEPFPISARGLLPLFSWSAIRKALKLKIES